MPENDSAVHRNFETKYKVSFNCIATLYHTVLITLFSQDTNSDTRPPNSCQANNNSGSTSNKPFGKRSLFNDELTETTSNHSENFDIDVTELNDLASNHKCLNDRKNNHMEARECRRNCPRETRKSHFDDGDEDIMLQYASFAKKDDILKKNEAKKLELDQSISTHSERARCNQTRDSLQLDNTEDQAKENNTEDTADITLIDFDDSFQIPNFFEEETKEASKHGTCQVKDSIGQARYVAEFFLV